eukprot:6459698-Amphidinium_carterae.2
MESDMDVPILPCPGGPMGVAGGGHAHRIASTRLKPSRRPLDHYGDLDGEPGETSFGLFSWSWVNLLPRRSQGLDSPLHDTMLEGLAVWRIKLEREEGEGDTPKVSAGCFLSSRSGSSGDLCQCPYVVDDELKFLLWSMAHFLACASGAAQLERSSHNTDALYSYVRSSCTGIAHAGKNLKYCAALSSSGACQTWNVDVNQALDIETRRMNERRR